jgi:hypothetical protein
LEIHTYLCSLLDGCSRFIIHWEIRQTMTEVDVETIIQRAREQFPGVHPRIISDNGPQFIAKDFKEFIRICGMTHVRTSPYYPQSKEEASYCTPFISCGTTSRISQFYPLVFEDRSRLDRLIQIAILVVISVGLQHAALPPTLDCTDAHVQVRGHFLLG